MRLFFPIAKVDAESRMVWGYASTEARDDQNEIVTRHALEAALGDYMKFANVREMHQLSAVGVAKEAAIDDKGLYVGAKIVDDRAWAKVVAGVYKGFSIGGRVLERAADDPGTITALTLNEISLVDRPANPEAVFDCWKAAPAEAGRFDVCVSRREAPGLTRAGRKPAATAQPVQVWTCGEAAHRHLAKADAVYCIKQRERGAAAVNNKPESSSTSQPDIATDHAVAASSKDHDDGHGHPEYADPGYQPDGKKRYPIDTHEHTRAAWAFINRTENANRYTPAQFARIRSRIIARWKEQIDPAGPPAACEPKASRPGTLRKALPDPGRVASLIRELGWLEDELAIAAVIEGDDSPQPTRFAATIDELCKCLGAMATEEKTAAGGSAAEHDFSPPASASGDNAEGGTQTETAKKAARNPIAAALAQPDSYSGFVRMLAQQRAEKAALLQTLSEIVPRLDALSKRVDDIARQPLPPKAIAKSMVAIAKTEDDGHPGTVLDPGALAAAFGHMSKEDQTLTLIKAARMNPICRADAAGAAPRKP